MVFFFEGSLLVLSAWVCYRECCLSAEGKGPPGAPEPPYPQGVAAGARPGGPLPASEHAAARGRLAQCARGRPGGPWVWSSVGQLEGGMSDKVAYNTYEPLGAGVGTRVPWPPVLAVLEGGVAAGHGRPLSAGRGERGGAPAEKGGGTVRRHCMRCQPLPASPGLGGGARRTGRAWSAAPGASPRRAPCPPDGAVRSRSTCLRRVVRGSRGLMGPPPGCWGCRSVALQGGAGGGQGAVVLLRQGPLFVHVRAALAGVAVGRVGASSERRQEGWRGGAPARDGAVLGTCQWAVPERAAASPSWGSSRLWQAVRAVAEVHAARRGRGRPTRPSLPPPSGGGGGVPCPGAAARVRRVHRLVQ